MIYSSQSRITNDTNRKLVLFIYELLHQCPDMVEKSIRCADLMLQVHPENKPIVLSNGWRAGMTFDIVRYLTGDGSIIQEHSN